MIGEFDSLKTVCHRYRNKDLRYKIRIDKHQSDIGRAEETIHIHAMPYRGSGSRRQAGSDVLANDRGDAPRNAPHNVTILSLAKTSSGSPSG